MNNTNSQTDPFENIKKAMLIQAVPSAIGVLFLTVKGIGAESQNTDDFLLFFTLINSLAVIGILLAYRYKNKRSDTYKTGELKERILKYVLASKFQYSTIQACALFTSIGFFITSNYIFMIESLIFCVWYIYIYPTTDKIALEIEE